MRPGAPFPLDGGRVGDGGETPGLVADGAGGADQRHPSRINPTLLGTHPHSQPLPHRGGEGLFGERVVAIARTWLGTPYQHQASLKGAGCDCLGLIRGVWRELYGSEPEALPPYRPDWAEVMGEESLLAAARRWLVPADASDLRPGDVVLFRMSPEASVKHCALVSRLGPPEPRILHAYWGRAVVESWLGPWWHRRLVAAFRFPDIPSE